MKFYKVNYIGDTSINFYKETLGEAHQFAKQVEPDGVLRTNLRITEMDVKTDRQSVFKMLSEGKVTEFPGRVWTLTPRGGLRELESGA